MSNLTKEETAVLERDLSYFSGTEHYYKHMGNLKLTDGTKYLAEKAQCYWLMDIIFSYQPKCMKDAMLRDFQVWTLTVEDSKGIVKCERDTNDVAFTQTIPYTDFPLKEIKLYCINDLILLPSEY